MGNESLLTKGDALLESGNYADAFTAYLEDATAGCAHSMLRLGLMYTRGEGVNCDYDKAIEWELKAAEAGEVIAYLNLGISYRIKGDILSAKFWFEKAIGAGDGSAAIELAKLYMVSTKEKAKVWKYLNFAINAANMCEADIDEARGLLAKL
ncbi:tetratricopeptide repeat protein [Cellvibrio mixtus]|uniref:tetratricopeptide repeat protein n=1 Tax=Cellvibrio mixtus TaxID=39650 RepID=UPI000693FC6B|nr:SEL1-like repeat protein [Cellvibrio mixtus]